VPYLEFCFRPATHTGYLAAVPYRKWKRIDHTPPDWLTKAPVYFITVCAEPRLINHFCLPVVGTEIVCSVRHYHDRARWYCYVVVLMPDHIHLLLSFPDDASLSRPIGEWKKWLVTRHAISWQENFFDHRLRNDENLDRKAEYILQNPVRAGLAQEAKDWPYAWMPS